MTIVLIEFIRSFELAHSFNLERIDNLRGEHENHKETQIPWVQN